MGWTIQGSSPGGGEIFRNLQTGPEAHPVCYIMVTGSFQGAKRPEHGADLPLASGCEWVGTIYPPFLCACPGMSWG